jgi:Tol biopolymer transport system component/DNA-binding winged helix-turn-helix (wHTH) protein
MAFTVVAKYAGPRRAVLVRHEGFGEASKCLSRRSATIGRTSNERPAAGRLRASPKRTGQGGTISRSASRELPNGKLQARICKMPWLLKPGGFHRDKLLRKEIRSVPEASSRRGTFCFGPFAVDLDAGELRKHGVLLRLQEQPLQVLAALLERPGEVITREELVRRLWPEGTFVDFDRGLNAAVTRLRQTLSDSAESPRYVETLARRGYRFMGPLDVAVSKAEPSPRAVPLNVAVPEAVATASAAHWNRHKWVWPILALLLAMAAVGGWWVMIRTKHESVARWVRITADSGLTTDPAISPDGKLLAYASDRGGGGLDIWVQQLVHGGQTIRITTGDADEHEPSFSPDGSKVVFRSEQNGGGVYIVSSLGGEPTMLAPLGRGPRFSPDGLLVSYWKGVFISSTLGAGAGEPSIFVVPAAGGTARELRTGLAEASHPVWSPDGTHIMVYGSRGRAAQLPLGAAKLAADWWVLPSEGGTAKPTAAFESFERQGLATSPENPRPGYWTKDGVIFLARLGDAINLWRIRISFSDLRVNGRAERVTSGTAIDAYPSVSQDGRLVLAGLSIQANLWLLPLNVNQAKVTGDIRRLTQGVVFDAHPSMCPDGSQVVFNSTRPGSGKAAIWIRNLGSGRETLLAEGDAEPFHPQISSDCSRVAYTQNDGDYVVSAAGGPSTRICTDCSMIWDWSRDQRRMLFSRRGRLQSISELDLSTKRDRVILGSSQAIYQARFSPDEAWVAFLAKGGISVARLRDGSPAMENEWLPITNRDGTADKPRWSSDGTTIYYTSGRDGFWCLWAQRVHPTTRRPVGPPLPVYHFHSARLSIANVARGAQEISIGKDAIVLNLGEMTGNIWASRE